MNLSISGLPAIAIAVGFVVVFSVPVWLAAKVVGADRPTLLRSFLALLMGIIGTAVSAAASGAFAIVLAPLSFLLSLKFVLGTSFLGAIFLAILAAAGYAAMVHFIGGGLSVTGNGVNV